MTQSESPLDDYFAPQPEAAPLRGAGATPQGGAGATPQPPAEEQAGPAAGPAAGLPSLEPATQQPEGTAAPVSAARRRRQRRLAGLGGVEFLTDLAHQGTPSFDFFLFSLLTGLVLAGAILSGAPAIYLLAALLAPFLAPVVGMVLAMAGGAAGFFLRSLVSLLIGGLLIFASGALAGLFGWQAGVVNQALSEARLHAELSWPNLLVAGLGAAVTMYLVVRVPRARPLVSSVALAYELLLPLGVAGYGLANGSVELWQNGLQVAGASLALALLVGCLVLLLMGLRPQRALAWLAMVVLLLAAAAGLGLALFGAGWLNGLAGSPDGGLATTATVAALAVGPGSTPSVEPVATDLPLPTPSQTPQPSRTPTLAILPSATATLTLMPSPTPVWGLVNAGQYLGAIIRPEPGSNDQVTSLLNGAVLQILPEVVNRGGIIWMHVRTPDGKEGWVQSSLILTATPAPK